MTDKDQERRPKRQEPGRGPSKGTGRPVPDSDRDPEEEGSAGRTEQ
jgi:hypothetical protein